MRSKLGIKQSSGMFDDMIPTHQGEGEELVAEINRLSMIAHGEHELFEPEPAPEPVIEKPQSIREMIEEHQADNDPFWKTKAPWAAELSEVDEQLRTDRDSDGTGLSASQRNSLTEKRERLANFSQRHHQDRSESETASSAAQQSAQAEAEQRKADYRQQANRERR